MIRRIEITLLVLALAAVVWWLAVTASRADDHIRPQCWEENRGGDVIRHCDVDRPNTPAPPSHQEAAAPLPPATDPPPPRYAERPPPFGGRYVGPQYVVPMYGPLHPPPYYYGPPTVFFRFGPLVFGVGR